MTAISRNWNSGNPKEASISDSEHIYANGTYRAKNPEWHLNDAPAKADDVFPYLLKILDSSSGPLKIADIGAGVGGVSSEVRRRIMEQRPAADLAFECFDLSESAVEEGRRRFPELKFCCREIGADDGPWDVCLLIDFLEHLENPHAFLRMLSQKCRWIIIRQPLQENYSTWRHNNYRAQREQWGHVSFFNDRSFREMASNAGWEAVDAGLYLSGEYGESRGRRIPLYRKLIMSLNREWAAYLCGAYLMGAFRSRNCNPS